MIKQAEFLKSITEYKDALVDYPQILILGRSNVGKSTFINTLTNRKSLARVSSTPGKTITLNYFLINNNTYLVDAPGYGYARRSKTQKDSFTKMISQFLEKSDLKKVFLLVDFKVGPTKDDLEMYDNLIKLDQNIAIILTKKDKVKSSMQVKQLKMIKEKLNSPDECYLTSSSTRFGFDPIYSFFE